MDSIQFSNSWGAIRFSALFSDNNLKNTDFSTSNALQFYFGRIIPKKKYELTNDLIETYKKYTLVNVGDIVINGLNLNYDFHHFTTFRQLAKSLQLAGSMCP